MATLVLATRYRAAFLARVYAAFAVISVGCGAKSSLGTDLADQKPEWRSL